MSAERGQYPSFIPKELMIAATGVAAAFAAMYSVAGIARSVNYGDEAYGKFTKSELSAKKCAKVMAQPGWGLNNFIEVVDPKTLAEDPQGASDIGTFISDQIETNGVIPNTAEAAVPIVEGVPKGYQIVDCP